MLHAKNIVNDMREGSIKHWWIHTHGVNPCDSGSGSQIGHFLGHDDLQSKVSFF